MVDVQADRAESKKIESWKKLRERMEVKDFGT